MKSPSSLPVSKPLDFWLCLGLPASAAVALLLLELTSLDMDLARHFYSAEAGGFIGRYSFFLEDILHDRAKQLVILFSVLAILGLVGSFILQRLKPYRRELVCLVLSLGMATAFVSPLKTVTAVQCPWSLKEFGGQETYSELLSPRPPAFLAINEPENSLHRDMLPALARLIIEASRYSQIWLTSHSAELAELIAAGAPCQRYALENRGGETRIVE